METNIDVIECMLSDAVEGNSGINYWAEIRKIRRDKNKPEVIGSSTFYPVVSFEVRDNGSGEVRVSEKWVIVNQGEVRKAVKKILNGQITVRRDIASQFIGKESDWDYDSEGIDCVIQVIAFNEILFG